LFSYSIHLTPSIMPLYFNLFGRIISITSISGSTSREATVEHLDKCGESRLLSMVFYPNEQNMLLTDQIYWLSGTAIVYIEDEPKVCKKLKNILTVD